MIQICIIPNCNHGDTGYIDGIETENWTLCVAPP